MEHSHYTTKTTKQPQNAQVLWIASEIPMNSSTGSRQRRSPHIQWPQIRLGVLNPIRHWLDGMDVRDRKVAQTLCSVIPAQCPFERTVQLFGHTVLQIPPLCKLNPFYEQLVGLRFRALCYLADECGEDIAPYC
jgi:hypothetical protein